MAFISTISVTSIGICLTKTLLEASLTVSLVKPLPFVITLGFADSLPVA